MSKNFFYSLTLFLLAAIMMCVFFILNNSQQTKEVKSQKKYIQIQKNSCDIKSDEPVNIVYITDSRYTTPTIVSMYSAIANKCSNSKYNFFIIAENISPADERAILKLKDLSSQTINITIIPQSEPDLPYENMRRFLQYKVGMHKIYLPEILTNMDKIIYMDGDTLVLKDLQELYAINIKDVYAAVAKDGIYYRFPKEMAEMGLDKRGYYFNSGVMLYNLKRQRQDNITNKLVEYIKTHEDFFGDQDVLNMVFGDKLKLMSYRYNCISTFFETDNLNFLSGYFGEALPEKTFDIYENATILHYAGDKPWQEKYQPEYLKELWFRYYNEIYKL